MMDIADVLRIFCLFATLAVCLGQGIRNIETVSIEECKPGKYFWQEENADEFFACLTLSRRAIKMKCSEGTYMCNTGPKVFQPCMCKGKVPEKQNTKINEGTDNNKKNLFDKYAKMAPEDMDGMNNAINAMLMSTTPKDEKIFNKPSKTEWPSLPFSGCPDPFRRYNNSHMFDGVVKPIESLIKCQEECMQTRECIGIDWDKRDATADDKRCWFIFPLSENALYGTRPVSDYCCDHFRRTMCVSREITQSPKSNYYKGDYYKGKYMDADNNNTKNNNNDGDDDNDRLRVNYKNGGRNGVAGMETTMPSTNVPRNTVAMTGAPDITTTAQPADTTTIPDSGCPYQFQEYRGISHPFGKQISSSTEQNTEEKCKYWCLIHYYCKAVDWDSNTNTCYYLPEVVASIAQSAPGVTHFRKIHCGVPLKCWTQAPTMTSSTDVSSLSISDTMTDQVECTGWCYVRQTMGTAATTVERGCRPLSDPAPELGCSVGNPDLMTAECFCDTKRCNGLSVDALASQLLHMPLDKDLSDHSGNENTVTVPSGYLAPTFSCLDKAINCSALFTGGQCVTVNSLSRKALGFAAKRMFFSEASFSIYFKRMVEATPSVRGMFGNSLNPNDKPTWQMATMSFANVVQAGIITEEDNEILDFPFIMANDSEWHLLVMTYKGTLDGQEMVFPELKLYVDGKLVTNGNTARDRGLIGVRNQPVTLGCVEGKNFLGFLDDARIFYRALKESDIQAIMAMRDANFW